MQSRVQLLLQRGSLSRCYQVLISQCRGPAQKIPIPSVLRYPDCELCVTGKLSRKHTNGLLPGVISLRNSLWIVKCSSPSTGLHHGSCPRCPYSGLSGGRVTTPSISMCDVKYHCVVAASRDDSARLISLDVVLTTWNTILADMTL